MVISSLSGRLSAGRRLRLGDERVVRVDAGLALGLPGAGRHADPLELALERALAGLVRLLLVGEARLLLLEPRRVVALPRDAVAAVELEDPAGHVVEEVAVVGDGDDGARVVAEEALEPRDRLGVEVVGRLVEQQQVGPLQQQAAQGDAPALAAGERRDVGVAGRQRAARPWRPRWCGRGPRRRRRRCGPGARPARAAACRSRRRGRPTSPSARRTRRADRAWPRTPSSTLPRTSLVGSSAGSWCSMPDGEAGREPGLAGVAVVLARHDPQQRRLAGAVGAEHADLGARVEGEVDARGAPRGRAGGSAAGRAW